MAMEKLPQTVQTVSGMSRVQGKLEILKALSSICCLAWAFGLYVAFCLACPFLSDYQSTSSFTFYEIEPVVH
jgi:hypothetical protein